MRAVILAAGYATRLYPLTQTIAKPLLPVGGRPMLDHVLDRIAEEHSLHGEDRATLYSSTEFKKVRLLYFTNEYKAWERARLQA